MARLALEYFCLVLVASVGVLQAAAAYNELIGISFFNRKIYGYFFAVLTIGPALVGFFTWDSRNATGIIQGLQQFSFFMLALMAALILTLAVSSLLQNKRCRRKYTQHDGLEALREVTFFQALRHRLSRRQ